MQLHLLGSALTAAARLVRAVTSSSLFEMGRPASAGWQRALRGRCARVAQATDEFHFFDVLVYGISVGLAGPLVRWLYLNYALLLFVYGMPNSWKDEKSESQVRGLPFRECLARK